MSLYVLIIVMLFVGMLFVFLFSFILYVASSSYGEISINESNETFNLKLNSEEILKTKSKRIILSVTRDDSHK